jgi:hypothetical protein
MLVAEELNYVFFLYTRPNVYERFNDSELILNPKKSEAKIIPV